MGSDMTQNLVVWRHKSVPNGIVLGQHTEIERSWELYEGVSRAADWPADFTYSLNPDFPNDTVLVDLPKNTDTFLVISGKLKKFFEERQLQQIEYLPVTILDHKERVASRDYFIANPLNYVDCMDLAASGARFSEIDKESVQQIKKLVLDDKRIDPKRELFRCKGYVNATLVRRELAQAMDKAGFKGPLWTELDKFRG
jgi:hypothetical protein